MPSFHHHTCIFYFDNTYTFVLSKLRESMSFEFNTFLPLSGSASMSVCITRHAVAMELSDSTIFGVTAKSTELTLGRTSLAVVDKNIMNVSNVMLFKCRTVILQSVRSLVTRKFDVLAFFHWRRKTYIK